MECAAASFDAKKRVPNAAPSAPSASAAASPRPSANPPDASSGRLGPIASRAAGIKASEVVVPPTWPPASNPCTMITSAPASLAATASATEPHCHITFIPAFFTCGTCLAGSPQKNVIAWIGSFSRVSTTPGARNGTSRLTASGFFVILRAVEISFWIASGFSPTSANVPSPPAPETAPASSASDTPPIAAETIGYSIPNSSVIPVLNIAQPPALQCFVAFNPKFPYRDPAPAVVGPHRLAYHRFHLLP